jgi:hypothetical protein
LFINQALASANENGKFYLKGRALTWEGRIIAKLGNDTPLEAIQRVEAGLETLTELETSPDIAIGRLFLGELYIQENQEKIAFIHLKAAETLFKEMGMDYWIEETGKIMSHFG